MIVVVGEIIYYSFANLRKIGGNTFHIIFHINNLEVPLHFITRIGDDREGRQIVNILEYCKIRTSGVQVDPDSSTPVIRLTDNGFFHEECEMEGLVSVDLLEYSEAVDAVLENTVPVFFYNTVCQRTRNSQAVIQKMLTNLDGNTLKAGDINTLSFINSKDTLVKMFDSCDVVRFYDEHTDLLSEKIGKKYDKSGFIRHLIEDHGVGNVMLYNEYGNIDLFDCNGVNRINVNVSGQGDAANAFGVADAFFTLYCIYLGYKVERDKALETAAAFAEEISQIKGAIPDNTESYKKYRSLLTAGLKR